MGDKWVIPDAWVIPPHLIGEPGSANYAAIRARLGLREVEVELRPATEDDLRELGRMMDEGKRGEQFESN